MDFGQHFLVNKKIVQKIIEALELSYEDTVLEIGGGKGALTEAFIGKVKKIYVVEIDKNLVDFLVKKFALRKDIEILNLNFLDLNLETIKEKNLKIVGNIPYSITSEILHKILPLNNLWKICVIMVQKEVAYKILAKPKSKFFGKLTLIVNFYSNVEKICEVAKDNFYPKPKVDSTVLKFLPNFEFLEYNSKQLIMKIIDMAFIHKRKTLLNSLSLELNLEKNLIKKLLLDSGIKPTQRPNEVDIYGYKKITEKLRNLI
ncbi:MAG: 16S rRNA (adenine(1518)-N(6)/adenine(1519)-N(6))-dimethyltransferase RsmA [Endomicrobiia bacterium]